MRRKVILDASVFVALIDRQDSWHHWAVEKLAQISPPLLTCEAAITETCFLLQRVRPQYNTFIKQQQETHTD